MMQSITVLCVFAACVCCVVASGEPSISNFRNFLHNVFDDVVGSWSNVHTVPDTEEELGKGDGGWVTLMTGQLEDLDKWSRDGNCNVSLEGNIATVTATIYFDDLRYTYDFITDNKKFSNSVGEMYGKVTDLSASLVFLANISDTSAVTARLYSFQLLPTMDVTTEEISKQNVTDEKTFSPYIGNSIVTFIEKKALPAVHNDINSLLDVTIAGMRFNMSSEESFATATTKATSKPITTTTKAATITTTTSRKATPSTITNPSTLNSASGGSSSSSSAPTTNPITNSDNTTITTKGKVITTTRRTKSTSTTSLSSNNSSPSSAGDSTNSTKSSRLGIRKTTESIQDKWLTANFNSFVDELLVSTGKILATQNMTPYSMPDGQEEMFREAQGSVLLDKGQVSGLDGFSYGHSISVNLGDDIAAFTTDFHFTNVTFRFNFSAVVESNSRPSGIVWGNITNLRGKLYFQANYTEASVVNYTLQDLQLDPEADFSATVLSNETLTRSQEKEVIHAAGVDVEKNLVPRLESELWRHMSVSVQHTLQANNTHSASVSITTSPLVCLVISFITVIFALYQSQQLTYLL